MSEVTHVPFNPNPLGIGDSPLGRICGDWERGGWCLTRVVPVHQYESIAVFERHTDDPITPQKRALVPVAAPGDSSASVNDDLTAELSRQPIDTD